MFGLGGTPTPTQSDDDPSEYTLRTLDTDTPSDAQSPQAAPSVSVPQSPVAVPKRAAPPVGLPVIDAPEESFDRPMTRIPKLDPIKSNAFFREGQVTKQSQSAPRVALPEVPSRAIPPTQVPTRPVSIDPMSARMTQSAQSGVSLPPVARVAVADTASIADFLQNQKQVSGGVMIEGMNSDIEHAVTSKPWAQYGGVLLVLALLGGLGYGGYSWWMGRTPAVTTVDTALIPKAPSLEMSKPGEIFLADKPNYLNITRQGLTTEALVAYLNQIADKVPNNGTAYEFLLRNEKFQSVPFDEFSKLISSDTTVPSMFEGADMTLYVTKTLNNRSLSLLVTPKGDTGQSMSTFSATDSTLPTQMKSLYVLGRKQPTIPEQSTFGNSDYRAIPIRYTNFTAGDTTLSLDYSLVDGKLLLSTSKDAHRAVLDKIKP